MPGWIRWIIYIVLLIGLVGAIIWGYQEQQEKNAILIKAENNYQRAFHDLTYRMDELDEKISTVLAMNAPSNISPQMANIWKITSEAKADVSQLPLSLLPFNQTKQLLNQIGDFAYDVSIRDLNDQPLNDQELQALRELKDQSNQMKSDLRQVQNQVLTDGVRWMDIEVSVATNDQRDDEVLKGLQVVEEDAGQFDGLSQLNDSENDKKQVELDGETYNQDDIEQVVTDYFELNEQTELTVTETGKGSEVPIYNVSFDTDSFHGYAEVTEQGGNVLSYLLNRDIGESTKSLHDGRLVAETLLKDLDYEQVEMVESKQYEKVGVYKFVHVHDDIYYYPDEIQVKVALDDGQVTGVTARDFILNENKREKREFEPTLTEEEAIDYIHDQIDVQTTRLAVIETEESGEVLAYEVLGTIDGTTYRVYINANDGFEERVERLTQSEEVY
ncbi:germination protein YpeB [Alkalibacillus almallahensis]|uniref:germination protein YpeB n=1 Tax=Alkalibacillus almallahensis TaxID=1379154 RepID=UPI00142333E0|nr:germination protein YpeB [Alkalibacillus almallahensis]NIK12320.1 spore germination protein [Alkalibacillus almallahensis]